MLLSRELTILFTLLFFFGEYVATVFAIVVGIIIIVRKESTTGLLGIWCLLSGISELISALYNTALRFLPMETISKLASVKSIIQGLLAMATIVLLFMYPKIRYKAKGLIAIVIIRLAVNPAIILLNELSNRLFIKLSNSALPTYYLTTVVSALTSIAVSIIIFLAYFKNKEKEEYISKMWIFHLLSVIFGVIVLIISI